jgi:hypothetical protein
VLRPADVDRRRALRIGLGAVHIRPSGSVQHHVERPEALGRRQRHVPITVSERHDLVAHERLDERVPELPARAGD